jgi:hypothetical protein
LSKLDAYCSALDRTSSVVLIGASFSFVGIEAAILWKPGQVRRDFSYFAEV